MFVSEKAGGEPSPHIDPVVERLELGISRLKQKWGKCDFKVCAMGALMAERGQSGSADEAFKKASSEVYAQLKKLGLGQSVWMWNDAQDSVDTIIGVLELAKAAYIRRKVAALEMRTIGLAYAEAGLGK
jgi:hypothetical protein